MTNPLWIEMSRLFLVFGQVEYTKQPFKIYLYMHIGESKQKENHFFHCYIEMKKKTFQNKIIFHQIHCSHRTEKRVKKKQMKQKKKNPWRYSCVLWIHDMALNIIRGRASMSGMSHQLLTVKKKMLENGPAFFFCRFFFLHSFRAMNLTIILTLDDFHSA